MSSYYYGQYALCPKAPCHCKQRHAEGKVCDTCCVGTYTPGCGTCGGGGGGHGQGGGGGGGPFYGGVGGIARRPVAASFTRCSSVPACSPSSAT